MDGMIQTDRFYEFVSSFVDVTMKDKEEDINWEFFLHKVHEGSFNDFMEEIETNKQNQKLSKNTIETTVKHSMNILNNFSPE